MITNSNIASIQVFFFITLSYDIIKFHFTSFYFTELQTMLLLEIHCQIFDFIKILHT